jgi:hypothetical protein
MWKILIPLLLLLAVVFIQLRRVEAFTDPACVRKPGAYSVRCTDGAVLDPQGTAVPSTCGYKPNITGVVTDPNGGICGSVPAACKGWAFNGAGVWTNYNLISNTGTAATTQAAGNRGTGGLSIGGYTGSYLGNPANYLLNTNSINSQLGSIWGGYTGTIPNFGTSGTTGTTTTTGTSTTLLPPTTSTTGTTTTATTRDASGNAVDASGNAVTTRGTGTINLSLADLITLFGSTATGTSAPPAATPPSNNPAPSTTAGQDFYNQFRPMLLDDINKAIEAKATVAPATVAVPVTVEEDVSCSPSLQQGTDFSTAQNNIQYNQEYIRKDSIPCYACSL